MSNRRLVVGALGALALAGALAVPAQAEPPHTTVVRGDLWMVLADGDDDLVAFVNITRDTFCTPEMVAAEQALWEWIQGGEQGDPPEFPFVEGLEPVEFSVHELQRGNLVASSSTQVPVELWSFEEGKSAAQGALFAPCFDTDGLADGTSDPVGTGSLMAEGTGTWTTMDTDWLGEGPRANPWSDVVRANLSGPGGDVVWTAEIRNRVVRAEYHGGKFEFRLRGL